MKNKIFLLTIFLFTIFGVFAQKTVRIGIIGLDTSHSIAFAKELNAKDKKDEYKDFSIVAAYPYGSRTIESSFKRIPGYIEQVEKLGVEVVQSIPELLEKVDYVLLETNDGNLHLEQAYQVLKSGKRVFIDKPLAASLEQAIAIDKLAKRYNVPYFSSSSLRFTPQNQKLGKGELGRVIGADTYSPASREPSHPDFGWYGIHGIESLFTIMGTGCVSVNRMSEEGTDVVVGAWKDGRIGSFRGIREGKSAFGGSAFTDKGTVPAGGFEGYNVLLDEIIKFFQTGAAPVTAEETLEIFTFMEASNISKKKNGQIISMEETYKKAEKRANKLLKKYTN